MSRAAAVFLWELRQGLRNRFLQIFAVASVAGGIVLVAAAPGPEALPMLVLLVLLFFGSLFAILVGWASGQQARGQGAHLFAQPLMPREMLAGKLAGTGTWCLALALLVAAPPAAAGGPLDALVALSGLALGLLLVFVLAGLIIGLVADPVPGLLAALLAWAISVGGWEVGLAVLADAGWLQEAPGIFLGLLLSNPAGAFRVGAMVGLEAVPFDVEQLDAWRGLFRNIGLVAGAVFSAWLVALFGVGARALARQEF